MLPTLLQLPMMFASSLLKMILEPIGMSQGNVMPPIPAQLVPLITMPATSLLKIIFVSVKMSVENVKPTITDQLVSNKLTLDGVLTGPALDVVSLSFSLLNIG